MTRLAATRLIEMSGEYGGWVDQMNTIGGKKVDLELQLLCTRWRCHDGAVDHGHSFGDAVYTVAGRF